LALGGDVAPPEKKGGGDGEEPEDFDEERINQQWHVARATDEGAQQESAQGLVAGVGGIVVASEVAGDDEPVGEGTGAVHEEWDEAERRAGDGGGDQCGPGAFLEIVEAEEGEGRLDGRRRAEGDPGKEVAAAQVGKQGKRGQEQEHDVGLAKAETEEERSRAEDWDGKGEEGGEVGVEGDWSDK